MRFKYLQKAQQEEIIRLAGTKEKAIDMLGQDPGRQFFNDFKIINDNDIKIKVVQIRLSVPQEDGEVIWKNYYIKFMHEGEKWSFLSMSNNKNIE